MTNPRRLARRHAGLVADALNAVLDLLYFLFASREQRAANAAETAAIVAATGLYTSDRKD